MEKPRHPPESRLTTGLTIGLVAAGAVAAGYSLLSRRRAEYEFNGKVVLITGGSRGLGLVLARELAGLGARLAISARDGQELDRAGRELRSLGAEVIEIVCDVRNRDDAAKAVTRCVDYFGGLDVLINNAGVIQVGPLETQTEQDFRNAIDTHFWGPFHMMQAAIPVMKTAGEGRIANIASIGGKMAVPHMAAYCASKFALVGLSSAMQSELASDGIAVTTVCPGLMRTGSHINAEFKGQKKKEYALFSIMDALPISSVSAESAAKQIIQAIRRGDAELIISPQAKLAAAANANFPELTATLLAAASRLLPSAKPGDLSSAAGLESGSAISPSFLTANIDAASKRNNGLKPGEAI